jgi:hypothetical protein
MRSRAFESFAGACAFVVAAGGIAYSVAFVTVLRNSNDAALVASSLLLLFGGVLSTAVLTAVYGRVRETDPAFALWGLLLGFAGGIGSTVHGGYDLAVRLHRPTGTLNVPASPVDPRGLATFGLAALGVLVFAWLIVRGEAFPRRLGQLGAVAGVLLLVVYVGRLVVLNPKSPGLLAAAVLSGFVLNPAWFAWTGVELRRRAPEVAPRSDSPAASLAGG